MAVIEMQKELGVLADGWWGGDSQRAYLAQGRQLDINWAYLRRKLKNSFSQSQVDGFNRIMTACNRANLSPQHAAYILATVWHESAATMEPIAEFGKGVKKRYGQWFKNSKGVVYGIRNGDISRPAYLKSDYPYLYYGRGDCQLTWLDNYIKLGLILGVDLANNPDLANDPDISADILVVGSMQGLFTGKSIPHYITFGTFDEFVQARYVINGRDKRDLIAGYAKTIMTAMQFKDVNADVLATEWMLAS